MTLPPMYKAGLVALGVAVLASAMVAAAPAQATGIGHHPVTVCHNGKELTFDDSALEAHLLHGDTVGQCAPVVAPTPVEGWWAMPNGGTPDHVTWDQPVAVSSALECGVWYQVDLYPSIEALRALQADGFLRNGEDRGIAISWRFVYGGDCAVVIVEPPVVVLPPAELPATVEPDVTPTVPAPSEPTFEAPEAPALPALPVAPAEVPVEQAAATTAVQPELAHTGADLSSLPLGLALIPAGALLFLLARRTRRI